MTKRIHIVAFGMALLLATSIVSASAFTTATVERDAEITMATDTNAVIGIEANKSVPGVETNTQDELELNLDQGTGLNTNATFMFGSDTPTDAFNITNNGDGSIDSVKLKYSDPDSDDYDNINFTVYDSDGNELGTVSEEDVLTDVTPGSGWSTDGTLQVVVEVDTTNVPSGDSLSGTLTIEASDHS
jgi:hypothetical protein